MLLKMLYCALHLLKALFHSAILYVVICKQFSISHNSNLIQSTGTRSTHMQARVQGKQHEAYRTYIMIGYLSLEMISIVR